jgi:hypothetical protein
MKKNISILFLLFFQSVTAQQNKIKPGIWGLPLFQSGFGIGSIGFERLNTKLSSSWQIHFAMSGGSFASDAALHKRKWVTAEKTYYIKSDQKKIHYFYSLFCEAGSRIKLPGHAYFEPDSVLNKTKMFEISPGASLGFQYAIRKKWGFELTGGPKLIFSKGEYQYYNSLIRNKYAVSFDKIRPGFRLMGSFYYQF